MPTLIEILASGFFETNAAEVLAVERGMPLGGTLKNLGIEAQTVEHLKAFKKTHKVLLPAIERYATAAILRTPGNKDLHAYLAGHFARLNCLRYAEFVGGINGEVADELALIAVKVMSNVRAADPTVWTNLHTQDISPPAAAGGAP